MASSIFIIFIDLGIGGIQRKIINIVNYLAIYRKKLKIYILLRKKTSFNLAGKIKNKNSQIIYYTSWLKKKLPFFFPIFIIYHVWKLKPKSILAFLDLPSVGAVISKYLLFWRQIKVVLSEDHYASGVFPFFHYGKLRPFALRIFYPGADAIFTCSQANKKDLIKNFYLPEKKIKLIYNWTDFIHQKSRRLKKKYDFLYVGRLDKVKNVIFLLRAIKQIKKYKKDVNLCLVGKGREEKSLKRYVEQNKLKENVFFAGCQERVKDYFSQSRICVFSPKIKSEGFPLFILEAMALKVPVLSRDFAGLKEFTKNNETIFIFKTKKEFIKKSLWLLNNPKKKWIIVKKARKYVQKYHSLENIKDYLRELGL